MKLPNHLSFLLTKEDFETSSYFNPRGCALARVVIRCGYKLGGPMTHSKWLFSQGKLQDNQETAGDGYMVIYEDNYRSWSPKHVFERCYRPITRSEKELI
jgi:hypothetical protein